MEESNLYSTCHILKKCMMRYHNADRLNYKILNLQHMSSKAQLHHVSPMDTTQCPHFSSSHLHCCITQKLHFKTHRDSTRAHACVHSTLEVCISAHVQMWRQSKQSTWTAHGCFHSVPVTPQRHGIMIQCYVCLTHLQGCTDGKNIIWK